MVRRSRVDAIRRLSRSVAWRELWMGMALAESFGLIGLYVWYTYFGG